MSERWRLGFRKMPRMRRKGGGERGSRYQPTCCYLVSGILEEKDLSSRVRNLKLTLKQELAKNKPKLLGVEGPRFMIIHSSPDWSASHSLARLWAPGQSGCEMKVGYTFWAVERGGGRQRVCLCCHENVQFGGGGWGGEEERNT